MIAEASSPGEAGARGITHNGISVDLRIVAPENFGNLFQHLTGSKQHNEALRTAAVKRGLHVSEYGVTDDSTQTTHACATEEEVYDLLGMEWIPPELRENGGELEAARDGKLPELVALEDIRGELHCHTTASDGRNTIEQMAEAAREAGYSYIAITDHSASHGFGNDVQPDELRAQIEHIRGLDIEGITVLAGSEVNIHTDGSLDYDDELLEQLDWIMASMHTSFRISEKEMTERMITAMEHPLVDAIGHPTGRLIDRREPYGARRRARRRGRDPHGHLPGDQREPGPARPQRVERPARRRARRDARDRLRRARHEHAVEHALRRGYGQARVDRAGSRGEHARVARARSSAEALPSLTGSTRRNPGVRIRLVGLNGDVCST